MAEEIAFENGRISKFEELMTLTLDRVILHTVVHDSSTSTYMPNLFEIEETFCGRTYVWTDGRLRPALLCRLYRRVDLKRRRSSCTRYLDEIEEFVEDVVGSQQLNVTLKLCLDVLKDWLNRIAVRVA